MTLNALIQLIFQSFTNPRDIAQALTSWQFSRNALWSAFAIVAIISGILNFAMGGFVGEDPLAAAMLQTPMLATMIVAVTNIVMVFCLHFVGQMLGGKGEFSDTLLVVIWLQVVGIPVQLLQLLMLIAAPGLYTAVVLAGGIIVFYVTLHFIDVLHRYNSLWAAFGTVVISGLGVAIGFAMIIAVIGGAAVQSGAI
ncbi:Yip1 domain-containing protein [Cognatiyoonia koreensis]|uniref:Yip1 domain-containing protein n=1 Tax=Cognatiyoonia koreensis TaxID=364200 RepID=A0A1I0P095_9RHOB|nr:Yip1 family protein [Cognatiyoonia koreensis]SEW07329.1 Yip1 domain-containing protein [Cognatiyoonia koreensis]